MVSWDPGLSQRGGNDLNVFQLNCRTVSLFRHMDSHDTNAKQQLRFGR